MDTLYTGTPDLLSINSLMSFSSIISFGIPLTSATNK